MKYAFNLIGEITHDYFGLEGEYLFSVENEVITNDFKNLHMDITYARQETS